MTTVTVPLSETVIKKYLKGRDSMAINELRDLHSNNPISTVNILNAEPCIRMKT